MTTRTAQVNVAKVLADTIISVTQDLTQGTSATQIVSIDCSSDNEGWNRAKACTDCIAFWTNRSKYNGDNQSEEQCNFVCSCEIDDINLQQQITCNFVALQTTVNETTFFESFMSNLYLRAERKELYLPGIESSDSINSLSASITSIYNKLRQQTMQSALQSLATVQVVTLKGPGLITGVNMKQMVDMVSNVLQSSAVLTEDITNIESDLLSLTTLISLAAIEQLIVSIVMILAVMILIIALVFLIKMIFDVMTLTI